jgi:hypothetical protein
MGCTPKVAAMRARIAGVHCSLLTATTRGAISSRPACCSSASSAAIDG